MQNAKRQKTTTILTMSVTLLAICMAIYGYIPTTEPAHASHGILSTFQSGDIQYRCHDNLSDLDYERIKPCIEFGKAVATWSDAISGLDIKNASSNAEITLVSGRIMMDRVNAEMVPLPSPDDVQHATIRFSTDYKWGDGTYWLHVFSRYDFQTISLHEMGHAFGLDHDKSSPLMKSKHTIWDVQRTIPSHDKKAVQEKFENE